MATEAANWTSQTDWTIASGSLRNCVTFQSDDDDSTTSKPLLLLLHSPTPDSPPCEITINFTQKHELRQIYVRSTARVYEVYYAPDLQSNNEYLCTVRCGVATRDGEILRSSSIHEIASSLDKDSGDESVRSEDDWVEVKGVDSDRKDLFEATAEINDMNPCISVTLRLLSLQSKGCVSVDEIYVFADPVDSEIQESRNENSSNSSLMAMFLPTLMQLSKTTGLSHLNSDRKEKQFALEDDFKEIPHPSDSVIKDQLNRKSSITDPHEEKLKEVKGGLVGTSQPKTFSQVAKMESDIGAVPSQAAQVDSNCSAIHLKIAEMENNQCAVPSQVAVNQGDSSGGNVEKALEKLMSRMDRIEEICLGFQEKMVMPMNNIEARLQQVEKQLDTLSKKFQNSEKLSGYRISAPDVSCIESDANSCEVFVGCTDTREAESDANYSEVFVGCTDTREAESDANYCEVCVDSTDTREMESEKKYVHAEVLNAAPRDMSDSENTTQLLPGLVVTAPEFPDGEDEDDNESEKEMNSSNDKEKQSIDDALFSALANFLSSSLSSESPKYTKSVTVRAPEFEDDDDRESSNEAVKNDSVNLTDSENCSHTLVLAFSSISLKSGENVNNDSDDKNSEKPTQEAEQHDKFCSPQGDQDEKCVKASILPEHNLGTDVMDNTEEDKNEKICDRNKIGEISLSNLSDLSNELVDNQTPDSYSMTQEGSSAWTELTVATEASEKSLGENIIENVLGYSLASSVVDFEIPVLDVKFISQRSPITMGFLEALLVETPETSQRDSPVKESNNDHSAIKGNDDISVEEHSNLISVDVEPVNPASNNDFILDDILCTSTTPPVNTDGDNLPEDHSNLISVDNEESASPASNNDFILDKVLCTWTTPPVNTEDDNLSEDHKRKHDQISTSSLI